MCYGSQLEGFSSQFVLACLFRLIYLAWLFIRYFTYLFIYLFIYYSFFIYLFNYVLTFRIMLVFGYGMAEYGPQAIPE